ncbi:MAG TPA: GNAT family N-acetyltransferase [Phycisphaerae bacterium]|nr:GNAT family N-acetyltransferase [Phycisphaerae bacterium]
MTGPAALRVRRYRETDHDEVWELHNLALHQVGAHAGNGPWDDDLHRIRAEYLEACGEFLVGELDGRIVAMGALRRTDAERAEITRMRVHPDFQRRGLGQEVLRRLLERARQLGFRRLHLDTTVGQLAAQGLYRANGFVEAGRKTYAGFDVIVFERDL